jgi:aspartate/glutamate racemase
MKTAGIIGGIGPESTIVYYHQIITLYRERKPDGGYPSVIINSIDLKKMLDLIESNELTEVTEYGVILPETQEGLLAIVERLKAQEGIEGVILGGTELSLILRDGMGTDIPFLDATQIHVKDVVAKLLS